MPRSAEENDYQTPSRQDIQADHGVASPHTQEWLRQYQGSDQFWSPVLFNPEALSGEVAPADLSGEVNPADISGVTLSPGNTPGNTPARASGLRAPKTLSILDLVTCHLNFLDFLDFPDFINGTISAEPRDLSKKSKDKKQQSSHKVVAETIEPRAVQKPIDKMWNHLLELFGVDKFQTSQGKKLIPYFKDLFDKYTRLSPEQRKFFLYFRMQEKDRILSCNQESIIPEYFMFLMNDGDEVEVAYAYENSESLKRNTQQLKGLIDAIRLGFVIRFFDSEEGFKKTDINIDSLEKIKKITELYKTHEDVRASRDELRKELYLVRGRSSSVRSRASAVSFASNPTILSHRTVGMPLNSNASPVQMTQRLHGEQYNLGRQVDKGSDLILDKIGITSEQRCLNPAFEDIKQSGLTFHIKEQVLRELGEIIPELDTKMFSTSFDIDLFKDIGSEGDSILQVVEQKRQLPKGQLDILETFWEEGLKYIKFLFLAKTTLDMVEKRDYRMLNAFTIKVGTATLDTLSLSQVQQLLESILNSPLWKFRVSGDHGIEDDDFKRGKIRLIKLLLEKMRKSIKDIPNVRLTFGDQRFCTEDKRDQWGDRAANILATMSPTPAVAESRAQTGAVRKPASLLRRLAEGCSPNDADAENSLGIGLPVQGGAAPSHSAPVAAAENSSGLIGTLLGIGLPVQGGAAPSHSAPVAAAENSSRSFGTLLGTVQGGAAPSHSAPVAADSHDSNTSRYRLR